MFESTQYFASELNERGLLDGVAKDLSKALVKLIQILLDVGVDKSDVSWIKAYLSNSFQYVDVDGRSFSLLPVIYGFLKGSVLGQLSFRYASMIQAGLSTNLLRLFADKCLTYTLVFSVNDQILLNVSLKKNAKQLYQKYMTGARSGILHCIIFIGSRMLSS